jgi:hypothetical protein
MFSRMSHKRISQCLTDSEYEELTMKLTLPSTWHTILVLSAFFATRSSTMFGMASEANAHLTSLDSKDAVDTSSSLRSLQTFTGYVTGFSLYDVSSKPNKLWRTLYNVPRVLDVAHGPNRLYSIRAYVAGEGIGSVVMQLQDQWQFFPFKNENIAPYALCGDNGVDLTSCGMSYYGNYLIRAQACSGANGSGTCSAWLEVPFGIQP